MNCPDLSQVGALAPRANVRPAAVIYCLCEPDGPVRYIGKSVQPAKRILHHVRDAASGKLKYHHGRWIRGLLAHGKAPVMTHLFSVPIDMRWQDAERFFIASARALGFSLTNSTEGGEGLRLINPEDRDRVLTAIKAAWSDPVKRARRMAAIAAAASTAEADRRRREIANRPDVKAKKADALRALYSTPQAAARFSEEWKDRWSTPEMKAKKSAASKAGWADPEAAARRRAAMSEGKRLGWARKKAAQAREESKCPN